jgi:xylulokinase
MRSDEHMSVADELLLGIDIGTQSTRAALFTADGTVVGVAGRAQEMHTPHPGWAEQDPATWWDNTVDAIRAAMAEAEASPGQIVAVGAGGQMHGTVPLSAEGELLSHGVQLWCDKRAAGIVDDFVRSPHAAAAARIAASPPVANWVGFKIKWLQEHQPDVYEKAWKFVVPKDYVNFRLTGNIAIDLSEASGAFLLDAGTERWSDSLMSWLDLDADKLPSLHRSADVIGTVTDEAARLTGLAPGTPVVAGGGDMLCTLLAAGLWSPGAASDITGTSSILSVFTEAPVLDPRLMNLHHVTDGWVPFGITDAGGVSLKWFKDEFCAEQGAQAAREGSNVYDLLSALAAEVPSGAEGLLFFPYLMGERTLGTPYARATMFGLTPRHGTGAVVRAIMEGVTFELKRTLDIVEEAGHDVDVVYHSGGGAYSALWSQIKADIYQKPVMTFAHTEGGLLGAAVLAGTGVGIYESAEAGVEQCLHLHETFTPNPAVADRYAHLYGVFTQVHDLLQAPFDELAGMP